MKKSITESLCKLHVMSVKRGVPFAFTLVEIWYQKILQSTIQLCHFPNFWGFSRLGHITAHGRAWEMLASDIYEFCLHAVRCLSEKCESLSHTATRKLGRTHYYLLHHNNHK